jgi:cytochrome c oxidase cbb3-type subunit 3
MCSGCRSPHERSDMRDSRISLRSSGLLPLVLALLVLGACEREQRSFRPNPGQPDTRVPQPSLVPRPGPPESSRPGEGKKFEANAYHVGQGKQFFRAFNCIGCHGNGGGGIGPALMDANWIYGGDIKSIYVTIRDGRPNGMPAFGGKIPDDQIWEIAAYVRSLSGQLRTDVAPNRNDSITPHAPESRLPHLAPKQVGATE